MKRDWPADELAEQWTLLPGERELLANKTGATRLGFAVLLKFFQCEARFPHSRQEVPLSVVAFLAKQVEVPAACYAEYDWQGRAIKYHRAQIRSFLDFREATLRDAEALTVYLSEHVVPQAWTDEQVKAAVYQRLRALAIEPPSSERLDRIIASAAHTFEERFCTATFEQLPAATLIQMDALLSLAAEGGAAEDSERSPFQQLKLDPGRVGIDNVFAEIAKLKQLRQVGLQPELFDTVAPRLLQQYRQRAAVENIYAIRRHPAPLRYALIAAYCWLRAQEITDTLVELLLQVVHRIGATAERRVERELIGELKRVAGKNTLLYQLADTALAHPDGIIREVLFPVVDEQTLADLVKEFQATGPAYRRQVSTVMRASYSHHYRRVIPTLLQTLEFRSNNEMHQPVMRALEVIKQSAAGAPRFYDPEEIPLDGVVRRETVVVADKQGRLRVDRLKYELCVLQALRERLRCKEIWVVGANRYRNPDEDLPANFEAQREDYYAALSLPLQAEEFIAGVKREMTEALAMLDCGLPNNPGQHLAEAPRLDRALAAGRAARADQSGPFESQMLSAGR
jgi:hypothetical protein